MLAANSNGYLQYKTEVFTLPTTQPIYSWSGPNVTVLSIGNAGDPAAMGWGMDMQEEDMTTKDAREGILAAIKTVMGANLTLPDPELDVSGCMLASMELGIKSVSWDMVKAEPEFQGLG
jgi:hypothetical protein